MNFKILIYNVLVYFGTGLVSLPFIPIYCATKSGILSYTKAVAVRLLFIIIALYLTFFQIHVKRLYDAFAWIIKLP